MFSFRIYSRMADEKKSESDGENVRKRPRRVRVAKCLKCSNEWRARNGNEEKPSKCPECGTRAVVWRDEYTPDMEIKEMDDEKKSENSTEKKSEEPRKSEEKRENIGDNNLYELPDGSGVAFGTVGEDDEEEEEEEEENVTLDSIRDNMKGYVNPFWLMILLGAAGAVALLFFLIRRSKNRRERDIMSYQAEVPETIIRQRSAF